jgi:hypothetical protein
MRAARADWVCDAPKLSCVVRAATRGPDARAWYAGEVLMARARLERLRIARELELDLCVRRRAGTLRRNVPYPIFRIIACLLLLRARSL